MLARSMLGNQVGDFFCFKAERTVCLFSPLAFSVTWLKAGRAVEFSIALQKSVGCRAARRQVWSWGFR